MNSKVTKTICYSLFRILLPITLLAAAVVRFNALSFLYAVFLLITPLLSYPNVKTIKGSTGNYLKVLIALGAVAVLTQCIFHIVLVAIATDAEPYGSMFTNCSLNENLARQIAAERLDGVPVIEVVRLVVPDLAVFIVALVVFIICHVILKKEAAEQLNLPTTQIRRSRRRRVNIVIEFFGEFLVSLLLGASGVILPSALNAIYFLSFLIVGTVWACYKKLGRKFGMFRVFLLIYTGLHLLTLHLYQFQFFQDFLPHTDLVARILGLTGIVRTNCDNTWMIEFHEDIKWPYYVNPGVLLLLYWVLAFETRHWFHGTDAKTLSSTSVPSRKKKKRAGTERELLVDDAENTGYSTIEPINEDGTPKASTSKRDGAAVDTDDEEGRKVSRKDKADQKRTPMVSMFVYIMKQSYVLSLISMMVWSITFLSWLTFVLLLSACIIWMIPKSRRACLIVSPAIVLYAEILLIIQFIFGMNLKDELPEKAGPFTYKEIGLMYFDIACPHLALQVFYTLFFWLTLRQFMREKKAHQEQTQGMQMEPVDGTGPKQTSFSDFLNLPLDTDMVDGYDSNSMKNIGNYVKVLLCKYWIFVCAAIMLAIAVADVVLYRIIYMFLFLLFVLMFQLSFTVWRGLMYIFWWVVIVYSMIVLIIIYTYQFSQFPGYWRNGTGLSDETLSDIGLEQYDIAGLFVKLLTPTGFLIVVILQVHYFHTPFLRMSALDRYKREDLTDSPPAEYTTDEAGAHTTDTESEIGRRSRRWRRRLKFLFFKLWNKASIVWGTVSAFLWRLTEIHVFKLVALVIMAVAVNEVSAISAIYVILLAAILPLTRCHIVLSHFAMIWTVLVILAKMMYQLKIVKTDYWLSNCTLDDNASYVNIADNSSSVDFGNTSWPPIVVDNFPNSTEVDNAVWVGLAKISSLNVSIAYYIRNYLLILIVIAFESITRYHQTQHFNKPNVERPKSGIIFPDIKRPEADKNLVSCVKFFANYLFYKFGLEICYIMSAITICVRVDAYSVVYAIFMGILLFTSRRTNARVWPLYVIVLAILLPIQFMSCVGIPYVLCIVYPWHNTTQMTQNLELWLFLPDYVKPPHAVKLVADFFQLLFVCLQWRVFSIERGSNSEAYGGGDNQDILPEVEANNPIPVADFTTQSKSYLDVVKYAVFEYMFWVTLAIVFITGTTRINLFSMGYVIGVFCFMWYGQDMLLKPLRKLLRMWDILIGYTFFVLLCKAGLQLIGCVYIDRLYQNECWLIQLLGINCLSSSIDMPSSSNCVIEEDDTGLTWDVICFVFLLLQRRIYTSHYFRHVVDELNAQSRLASRGAELINRIMIREVNRQKAQEEEILYNIKKQMKSLKDKQTKLKKNFSEPDDHYEAIRSGDYYLFDDDSDEEGAPDQADTLRFGQDPDEEEGPKMGPLQVISTAVDSGTDAAVQKHKEVEEAHGGSSPGSPKPGTSAAQEDEGEELPPEKALGKAKKLMKFVGTILQSMADWLIRLFNKISKNYRRVARQLEKEMINMKENIRAEKSSIEMKEKKRGSSSSRSSEEADGGGKTDSGAVSDPELVEVTVTTIDSGKPASAFSDSISLDWDEKDREEEEFQKSQPRIYRLLVATYYALVSQSELLCYFLMILNMMIYASLLALPLPLMVFLWGMLSVPRPSKTFWITVITYIEAIVVVKYLFQFSFFPWNDGGVRESPFWPPRILGIEKQSNYASADLALLLALFIHRSLLKRYGLWKDTDDISADLAKAGEKELSPPCSPAPDDDNAPRAIESAELGESGASTGSQLQSSTDDEDQKKPSKVKEGLKKCVDPFRNFFKQVTGSSYNATVDVYAPMFFCDFIVFLIVVFGYWAFGPAQTSGSGDVTSYISENRVPVPFLVMLITQFALIVIDRALFLRKNVLGKFIFQIILVIVVHVWMFFVLPGVTDVSFNKNIPALLWYFIKCIYFGLSAYQIRCGYPNRILGNFLTKKYNYLNLFLFKGFLAIPFLLELRALMDWIWTDTTLAIGSWLQLEDIYANIFVLKCWRRAEATYPTPRAMKRKTIIKYGVGGLLLLVIIFIIWFPLVLFSFANTVFEQNPPYESTVTITVGGYQPIFKMTAQQQNIRTLTNSEYNILQNRYIKDRAATGFLSNYEAKDVSMISLTGKSTSLWGISPPSQDDLIRDLRTTNIKIEYYVNFVREPSSGSSETVSNEFILTLDKTTRDKLIDIINGTSNTPVEVSGLFPRFIRLTLEGRPMGVKSLLSGSAGIGYSNISLSLKRDNDTAALAEFIQWWQIQELIQGDSVFSYDKKSTPKRSDTITMLTFNDRKAPAGFSVITGYGIIGLYVSLVLVVGRFFRVTFFTGSSYRIMFEELPYVDKILQLCLDIYMVRESRDYRMEEDLFAKLLFLYRSPESLIKWTKRKVR